MAKYNYEDFPSLSRQKSSEPEVPPVIVPELEELTLSGLDLKHELLTQYNRARQLLHQASYDSGIPLNQKATVINSATTILAALVKSEAELHSVAEVKKIEAVLIETLRLFPEVQEMFMKLYKEAGEVYSV